MIPTFWTVVQIPKIRPRVSSKRSGPATPNSKNADFVSFVNTPIIETSNTKGGINWPKSRWSDQKGFKTDLIVNQT